MNISPSKPKTELETPLVDELRDKTDAIENRVKVLEVKEQENSKRRRNMKYTSIIGFLLGFTLSMFIQKQYIRPDLSWSWIIIPSLLLIITIIFWKRRRIND